MVARLIAALLWVPALATVATANDPYATSIELSDGAAGAASELTFRFRATGSAVEKVDDIEIGLPEGALVNVPSFRRTCTLEGTGPKSAASCGSKYRDARIGHGNMTVELLGMHTVKADAYRIDATEDGSNLVFFFPEGQVFGVGAQSVLGSVTLDGSTPARLRITNIQNQLDLPFGATAELEKGSFTFSGEPDSPGFTNPEEGQLTTWRFETKLTWADAAQTQRVQATATK